MAKKFDAKGEGQATEDHRGGARRAAPRRARLRGAVADEVDEQEAAGGRVAVTPAPGRSSRGRRPRRCRSPPLLSATTLTDSDPAAQAGSGQLLSFDRFSSKDPFVQQVDATAAHTDRSATRQSRRRRPSRTSRRPRRHHLRLSRYPRRNPERSPDLGQRHERTGRPRQDLPSADPVFRLVALTRTTAKVGIAGGSLSTGDGTTTLTKGKKVTLMNTADGTRYELVLVSVS